MLIIVTFNSRPRHGDKKTRSLAVDLKFGKKFQGKISHVQIFLLIKLVLLIQNAEDSCLQVCFTANIKIFINVSNKVVINILKITTDGTD